MNRKAVIDPPRPGRSLKRSLLPLKWLIQLYTVSVHTLFNSLENSSALIPILNRVKILKSKIFLKFYFN